MERKEKRERALRERKRQREGFFFINGGFPFFKIVALFYKRKKRKEINAQFRAHSLFPLGVQWLYSSFTYEAMTIVNS